LLQLFVLSVVVLTCYCFDNRKKLAYLTCHALLAQVKTGLCWMNMNICSWIN